MTSQGSAHARFERAIAKRSLLEAEAAARELGGLSLADALAFTVLLAEEHADRYAAAAIRWHGRLELEAPGLTMGESQLVLAALAELAGPHGRAARDVLEALADRVGVPNAASALRPFRLREV